MARRSEAAFGAATYPDDADVSANETDGSGRDIPISTCVLHRGMPIQFSNGDTTLADVNADGMTDLVQVRFDAVDVWLNLGGTAWSDRVILDGVPYHPGIVNRIRVADVNGSTTTDVMWGTADRYQFLDFTGGIQPRLLVSVENGMGKTSEIAYRSSTAYAAEARAARTPWTSFSPFPTQVVASSTVTDGLGARYVTEYKYQNAFCRVAFDGTRGRPSTGVNLTGCPMPSTSAGPFSAISWRPRRLDRLVRDASGCRG